MQENATPAKCFSRGDGSDAVPHSCFCTQKDLHDLLNLSFRAGLLCSCASRSRTYDGGVKVPCLTAWRWRTGKNQYSRISFICQAKAFCRVCAKCFSAVPQEVRRIFAAFSVCCLPHLRRFGSVFGLCGRDPAFSIFFHVFTKGKFCGMRFSKNTVRRGHKIHIAKVRFIFS